MVKRYRDPEGRLTVRLDELARLTREEGAAYYVEGGRYVEQGRVYTLHYESHTGQDGTPYTLAHFLSDDGYNLYCDPDSLGTFLPDIASEGLEIVRI